MALAEGGSIDRVEVEFLGRLAERDTRLLTIAVLKGVLAGHTEEEVNYVNAPALAEERGIVVSETKRTIARDFTDLMRVTVVSGGVRERVVGTMFGAATGRTCSRPGGSASTCSSTTTSPCSATPTCPGWSAAWAPPWARRGLMPFARAYTIK